MPDTTYHWNAQTIIKKVEKNQWMAFIVIILGVVVLLLEFYSVEAEKNFFYLIGGLSLPVAGILLLISTFQTLKRIKGSYFSIDKEFVSFYSRGIEIELPLPLSSSHVEIKIDQIDFNQDGQTYTFFLDGLMAYEDRKVLKQRVEQLIKTQ